MRLKFLIPVVAALAIIVALFLLVLTHDYAASAKLVSAGACYCGV